MTALRTRVSNVDKNPTKCTKPRRLWGFSDPKATGESANRWIERPCEQISLSWLLAVDFGLPTDQGLVALASERLSRMFRNPSLPFPKVSDSDQAGSKGQSS